MEDSSGKSPRFILGYGAPTDHVFFGLLSLPTAVYIVIAFDVLLSLLYVLESVMLILLNGLIAEEFVEMTVSLVGNSVSILALPFAVVGLIGMRQLAWEKFHVYFLYKVFETFFICIYSPATSYLYCNDSGFLCEIVTLCAIIFQKIGVDLYFTYLVWSADHVMKTGTMQSMVYSRAVELMDIRREGSAGGL